MKKDVRFVYTTKFGRISEPGSDMKELGETAVRRKMRINIDKSSIRLRR